MQDLQASLRKELRKDLLQVRATASEQRSRYRSPDQLARLRALRDGTAEIRLHCFEWLAFELRPLEVVGFIEGLEVGDGIRVNGLPDATEFDVVWRFIKECARACEAKLEMQALEDAIIARRID